MMCHTAPWKAPRSAWKPTTSSVFTPVRFLTTGIISGMAYASVGSLYQQALYSIGLVLFLFIMLINVFLNVCVKNRKEG